MSIKDKIAKIRGMGHHVPVGLDDILEDMDKRIEALEPKAKEEPKPEVKQEYKPAATASAAPGPAHDNPLDGTTLKS